MKKLMMLAACAAILTADALRAENLSAIELKEGNNSILAPSQAVALQAISTNASGTVILKKVTTLSVAWNEIRTVTNVTYTTAWSNVTHTVTNDVVTAWRTNLVDTIVSTNGVTNLVVATNFLARAVNEVPSVYPWPDLLILTNKVASNVAYTNIPYTIESSRRVETVSVPRRSDRYVTNDILSVTLSSGFKTNAVSCLFAPGDYVYASGTAFSGGRVHLLISR